MCISFGDAVEETVCHGDIFVDQRAPIIAARGDRALYMRIAEFGESSLVDLDITAACLCKGVKLTRESVDRIRPELIHILVCSCRHRGITAAEVQRAGPWNRDLRPAIRLGFEESGIGRIDRMDPLHAAADNRNRPLCPSAPTASAPPIVSMRN